MSVMQILNVPVGEQSGVKIEGVTCTKRLESAMPCIRFSIREGYWVGVNLTHLDGLIEKLQEFREMVVKDGREEYLSRGR